jgi:hypothetical protein
MTIINVTLLEVWKVPNQLKMGESNLKPVILQYFFLLSVYTTDRFRPYWLMTVIDELFSRPIHESAVRSQYMDYTQSENETETEPKTSFYQIGSKYITARVPEQRN